MFEKIIVLLLLLLTEASPSMRDCDQTLSLPASCMSSTNRLRISLTKHRHHYMLKVCFRRWCTSEKLKCDMMCDTCESIFGEDTSQCSDNEDQCESQVVMLLGSYCTSNTTPPPTVTTDQPGLNFTCLSTMFKTVLVSPTCTSAVTVANQCTQLTSIATAPMSLAFSQTFPETGTTNNRIQKETNAAPLIILGVLFGLSVILLAVVTTGWVWTLWTLKKHQSVEVR